MRILTNHVGYSPEAPKVAVVQSSSSIPNGAFRVVDAASGEVCFRGELSGSVPVNGWGRTHPGTDGRPWQFAEADFTGLSREGTYRVEVPGTDPAGPPVRSEAFGIAPHRLLNSTASDAVFFFRGMRRTGPLAAADREATFVGDRPGSVDVRGGWCDASADWSKNLSHLNHSNYMNPQQVPLAVWAMLETAELAGSASELGGWLVEKCREEAAWGADALVRMQDPAGYFYEMAIYDRGHKRTRIANHTYGAPGLDGPLETYQAGFRQGGGMAIAALARAAAADVEGDFPRDEYLRAAERGFDHLAEHNVEYLDDGRENLLDDYCALLAATELHLATGHEETPWLAAARERAANIVGRISSGWGYDGWLRADDAGERPFFHASDEGLCVYALLRYQRVEPDRARRTAVTDAVRRILDFQLAISTDAPNPFRLVRQLTRPVGEQPRAAFFMPHKNETRYWWQGESARLASLAAQLAACSRLDVERRDALLALAHAQLDWILGCNPFDACLLHGTGRGNPFYLVEPPNIPGGVCNGITADPDDPEDVALCSGQHGSDPRWTWRWAEQWICHGAWLLVGVAALDACGESGERKRA